MTTSTTANLGFQNWYSTTLSSGITASDTVIYLDSLPTPSEGFLVIEPDSTSNREIIFYNSKGANYVTVPTTGDRGRGGTTATSHNSGATVQMNITAEHFTAIQDGTFFTSGGIGANPYATGWTPILGSTPNTVTANGNRNYDLVFNSVDLSSTLSPGMKLKLTRTVAAPSQCTSLNGTTQYYSRASGSMAGMTFTGSHTMMGWVKLSSYPTGDTAIVQRTDNSTGGFSLGVKTTGQVRAFFGGTSNFTDFISYASLPLNKWVHVACSVNAAAKTAVMLFDGVVVTTSSALTAATSLAQTSNFEIGRLSTNYFPGKIAQVAVFSTNVATATLQGYMNQGLAGNESSLVSAYSFNNSINDLNANANNLTANGSAVATNADSPFANAVTAGTQEYAEINSVTFSTNTTVNVRVPDTCMIPTSGGISNVYYATGINPYGLPYFSKTLAQVIMATTFTVSSATDTQVSGVTLSPYIPTNARVRITVVGAAMYNGTNADSATAKLWDGAVVSGTQIGEDTHGQGTTYAYSPAIIQSYVTASGSKTYNLSLRYGASGTARIDGTTVRPLTMTVELV